MPLARYQFNPGINREGTALTAEGGWYDGNLVRFRKGFPEKIGGWTKATENSYLGTGRSLHGWVTTNGTELLGLGTRYKLYVQEGNSFTDITPIRTTTSAGDVTFDAIANTISAGISATDTVIPLTSSTDFPSVGVIQIDSETITYGAVSGNNLIGATRGAESTTAATHSSSAAVLCATITATDTAHGAVENDFVTFSGVATAGLGAGGNITEAVLEQEYQVATVPTVNTYTFAAKDTSGSTVFANSSDDEDGGSAIIGAYQINVGLDVFVSGTGWGSGTWGSGTWGSTSGLTAVNQLRLWSMDNFGEDLVACPRAGGVYYWDYTTASDRAKAIKDLAKANLAPTVGLQVLVSDIDRHLIVLGADPIDTSTNQRSDVLDPLLIAWCDQENPLEWEPKITNTAGSLRASVGSEIIGGLRARQETLIWTDAALYSLQFVGSPYTFGLTLINEGVSLIGPNAAINAPSGVYWMDRKGFYRYSGSIEPVPSSVHSYVFDDLNEGQSFQVFGFLNKQFDEVGWFYCSSSATVIDRYVTYNYVENTWAIGQLSRTAWLDEGLVSYPRSTGASGGAYYLYKQETGNDDDGSPMDNVYLESGDFDLDEGEEVQFIRRMIPDVKFTGSGGSDQTLNVVLKTRNYPAESLTTESTSAFTASTTVVEMRARARQAVLRFESDDDAEGWERLGVGFRIGATRLDIQANGRR